MVFDKKEFKLLERWCVQREIVRNAKEKGKPKPWTDDVLLQQFKFCNVRRADDRVSRWLLENWYSPTASKRTLVIAAALARLINWPEALIEAVPKLPFTTWNPRMTRIRLEDYRADGNKVFTGAYIINGAAGGSKINQVVNHVHHLACAMLNRSGAPLWCGTYRETVNALAQRPGLGPFMAGQIATDLHYLHHWPDGDRWAPIGPGSRRGMRRLLGMEAAGPMGQAQFDELLPEVFNGLGARWALPRNTSFMDVQNCLCEFDKYRRLMEGGHVRSRYNGTTN